MCWQLPAYVNAANVDGSTALHWAARKNNVEGVRLLLTYGAERGIINRWGATALDNAVWAPRAAHEVITLLSTDKPQVWHCPFG